MVMNHKQLLFYEDMKPAKELQALVQRLDVFLSE
jgi:hypothetical protein